MPPHPIASTLQFAVGTHGAHQAGRRHRLREGTHWVDGSKPPAATIGAAIIVWAIWELASSAHGNHEPPHGNPGQGPLWDLTHKHMGGSGHSNLPPDSGMKMDNPKGQEPWLKDIFPDD